MSEAVVVGPPAPALVPAVMHWYTLPPLLRRSPTTYAVVAAQAVTVAISAT